MTLKKYFISAYATSQVLHGWDETLETVYFQALAADPRVAGIELPYLEHREAYPTEWLLKNIPKHWGINITPLPAVMQLVASNPKAGLASTSEPNRKIAIELMQKVRQYAEELQQAFGRPVIRSVNIYSSPQNSTPCQQGNKEALQRSLVEIKKMKWGQIALNLEHCDAFLPSHLPDKGFLSLADEIEALSSVGGIGLVLNWGRSAIEARSADGPLKHLREALSHQLLRGFVFSGCAADSESPYGTWKDRHAPPRPLCPESLLGEKEIVHIFEELQKEKSDFYFGIKVSNRFVPFDIKRSVELNLKTMDLLVNTMMRDCRTI